MFGCQKNSWKDELEWPLPYFSRYRQNRPEQESIFLVCLTWRYYFIYVHTVRVFTIDENLQFLIIRHFIFRLSIYGLDLSQDSCSSRSFRRYSLLLSISEPPNWYEGHIDGWKNMFQRKYAAKKRSDINEETREAILRKADRYHKTGRYGNLQEKRDLSNIQISR